MFARSVSLKNHNRLVLAAIRHHNQPQPHHNQFITARTTLGGMWQHQQSASFCTGTLLDERMSFQTETKKLLNIVTHSLYTDKEVFLRELISNASDALERLRFMQTANDALEGLSQELCIKVSFDKEKGILTIEDGGLGMTREEMIANLGTIARSGSRHFLEQHQNSAGHSQSADNTIGQFGVGFYSSFVVADEVEVFSKSGSKQHEGKVFRWKSDGTGEFTIGETHDSFGPDACGTKIVMHIKKELQNDFLSPSNVRSIIKKFSGFINFPIDVDGDRLVTQSAIWTRRDASPEEHSAFLKYISGGEHSEPRFVLPYQADAPLSLRSVFYFPKEAPHVKVFQPTADSNVALYCRKVLVKKHANELIPHWLRFVHGVVVYRMLGQRTLAKTG